jgi:hypothetical protein
LLRELQLTLGRAFHEPGGGGPESDAVLSRLRGVGALGPAETLALYRRSVAAAREQALRQIYPVCAALVGDDCFRSVSRLLSQRFPSTAPDLARIGDRLPELVPELSFLDALPYLGGVASLELARHRAFFAPDPPAPVDVDRLAEAVADEPDRFRFVAAPSLGLVSSEYPLLEIWQAHHDSDHAEIALDLAGAPASKLAVWRRADEVRVERIAPAHFVLLESIEAGAAVSHQLRLLVPKAAADTERLLEQDPDEFAPALESIGSLFGRGLITGLERATAGERAELRN